MSAGRRLYDEVAAKLAWAIRLADAAETEPTRATARSAVLAAAWGIADAFAADNPRFDRDRFLAAVNAEVDK